MKALVVGYGSIGQRHYRLLEEMGLDVAVVSSRPLDKVRCFKTLNEAKSFLPDYVVISTETSRHIDDLSSLADINFSGKVLVEKPLFSEIPEKALFTFPIYVAYQLRFHPLIIRLKEALKNSAIYTAHLYVGQHLSTWRPNRNMNETYSALKAKGGGALRDLSHEIDILYHLFGEIENYHSIGGKVANVTVDSDDAYGFLLQCSKCPIVTLQMNYLDHVKRREMIIVTEHTSYKLDFVSGIFYENEKEHTLGYDVDTPYREMHKALCSETYESLCSLDQGLAVVKMITEAEANA